jgi:hypothetical protein
MPIFRYFMVMGCCLLGLLLAASRMWPGEGDADLYPATIADVSSADSTDAPSGLRQASSEAPSTTFSSIDSWRRAEGRFERAIHHPKPIIYPSVATLAPTADRLQWERQLRYLPENHVYEARAEMPKEAATEPAPAKVAERTVRPHRKHVAHAHSRDSRARTAAYAERYFSPRYARNTGWNPFGLFD